MPSYCSSPTHNVPGGGPLLQRMSESAMEARKRRGRRQTADVARVWRVVATVRVAGERRPAESVRPRALIDAARTASLLPWVAPVGRHDGVSLRDSEFFEERIYAPFLLLGT